MGAARGLARLRAWLRARPVPEGIRITRVGLWYLLFALLVAAAAVNTGNNALYMVVAVMLALLVVSGFVSRANLTRLELELSLPAEIFARRPAVVAFTLRHRGRLFPRWLLVLQVGPGGRPRLVPFLPVKGVARGATELLVSRRGRHRIGHSHFSSLFPLGLFRKGLRYPAGIDLLVYPELFPGAGVELERGGLAGEESSRRAGWGHELHALRAFRPGDDPRWVHWRKSARTGDLIFTEREAEETLRLSILLDNGLPTGVTEEQLERFERLVSEAASAAVDHLERGFEVELVTRTAAVPFGGGARQRRTILETLALLESAPRRRSALLPGDPRAKLLRLGLGSSEAAA
ncbi:MAG: DUF58 domain-containing protein [Thermoanaerobaculia bacterium]|nr:DUF58 domain-containing protein [Thermoanaerobaculia bacterium]